MSVNASSFRSPAAALLAFLASALLCCGGPAPSRDRDSLYFHLHSEPSTLNPILSNEHITHKVLQQVYESLIDRDFDTLKHVPQLAERWSFSPDKLRIRFFLKKGVLWSDGEEFTADDVLYTYNVIKDPKVPCAPMKVNFIDVSAARKIDRYTVEFTYTRPYFEALNIFDSMPIMPKHVFDDGTPFVTHRNNRNPVGTGPYRFVRWDTGKRIVLTVNERYRGKKPLIKTVVYKAVSEINIALQMLKKGELDVMELRAIQWVRQTNSRRFLERFHKLKYYYPNYSFIGWNQNCELFRDRRVRQAMTMFINREQIMKKLSFGLGRIVTGHFNFFSEAYNPDIKPWPYDPAAAERLLAEAGWKRDASGSLVRDGKKFSFTFSISSGSKFSERLTTILKEDLSKIGIEMNISRYEWAVYYKKLTERDFEAVTLSWMLGFSDDPYQIWHSSQIKGGSNNVGFRNREADRIIETARRTFDDRKRNVMYRRLGEILHEEQPYTFLFSNPTLVVVSRKFENVKIHRRGLNFTEWRPRRD